MRRNGSQKFIKLSVFFLVYSITHIVSGRPENKSHTFDVAAANSSDRTDESMQSPLKKNRNANYSSKLGHGMIGGHGAHKDVQTFCEEDEETEKIDHGLVLGSNAAKSLNMIAIITDENERLKLRDWRVTQCIPSAIQQFLRPFIPPKARRNGALIIHTIVAIYMFVGLTIVCDEYFVASLGRISKELKLSKDVVGATFMAAGSSAPELATVIMAVFYAEDDIGISGIIGGSAVFNATFVISVCALATGTVVYLNWWPLIRDSIFYAISILIILTVISDKEVSWLEALTMILVYGVYCIVLHFNPTLERWAQTISVSFKTRAPNVKSGVVTKKTLEDDQKLTTFDTEENEEGHPQQLGQREQPTFQEQLQDPALNQVTTSDISATQLEATDPIQQDYYNPKEYDPSTKVNYLLKPTAKYAGELLYSGRNENACEAGLWQKIKWGTVFPIHFFCIYTMPDCRNEKYKNWYPLTFVVSILWISFYSYIMIWMITIIGYTLGIPDAVMRLTFVAAGMSVPDALSSIAAKKAGYGDMAISNAIGSNVFNFLICMGLPWFIVTASYNIHAKIFSKGLLYLLFSLLSSVAFLVIAIQFNGWKLDRKLGIVLMVWYLIFTTFASSYELNIFGYMYLLECVTDY